MFDLPDLPLEVWKRVLQSQLSRRDVGALLLCSKRVKHLVQRVCRTTEQRPTSLRAVHKPKQDKPVKGPAEPTGTALHGRRCGAILACTLDAAATPAPRPAGPTPPPGDNLSRHQRLDLLSEVGAPLLCAIPCPLLPPHRRPTPPTARLCLLRPAGNADRIQGRPSQHRAAECAHVGTGTG